MAKSQEPVKVVISFFPEGTINVMIPAEVEKFNVEATIVLQGHGDVTGDDCQEYSFQFAARGRP